MCELYGKLLQEKAYSLHPGSLYRMFVRLGYRKKVESTKKRSKHLWLYETPTEFGEKWQLDVKYVPQACYVGKDDERFFQYTMLEEASRERFIYTYKEQSGYSTVNFMKRALLYFDYSPQIIQTDNGSEFYNGQNAKRILFLIFFCAENHILHKRIRVKTPWHNGKVERRHRNDQERFYEHLSFYSFEDLQLQMEKYLRRSDHIPMSVLGWRSPIQRRKELLPALFDTLFGFLVSPLLTNEHSVKAFEAGEVRD